MIPRKKLLLGAAALAALIAPVVFGLAVAQQDAAPPSEAEQLSQQAARFGPDIKYDVVSIRLNKSVAAVTSATPESGPSVVALSHARSQLLPDGLTFRDTSFRNLFHWAYPGTPPYLISGEPDWWTSEKYDVLAKADGTVAEKLNKLTFNQLEVARSWMMQELLADRFKLKVHWETRQLPRYAMTVANGGPKFKESPPNEDHGSDTTGADGKRTPSTGRCQFGPGQAEFVGVTMTHLAFCLEANLGRPLADETGLAGHYDFKLRWDPSEDESPFGDASSSASSAGSGNQPALAASAPSGFPGLRKALQQQLDLQLRQEAGPVRVLVIDHVEKPSEN